MKIVILSIAIGEKYKSGIIRLEKTLNEINYTGDIKIWYNEYPEDSPSHEDIPYAFKAHAFKWAINNGYDYALWLDAAIYLQNDIVPVLKYLQKNEYLIFNSDSNTGAWSTDQQLEFFGYTREDAFSLPHAMACIIGFKLDHIALKMYMENTNLFIGQWNNNGDISKDIRVKGSRHDQTVISLIACKLNLTFTDYGKWGNPYNKDVENIFISQGF